MGVSKKNPPVMTSINRKYVIEAAAQYLNGIWGIFVSVMNEDGSPVTTLQKANFLIARVGNGGAWSRLEVNSVQTQGKNNGFYSVFVYKNTVGNQTFNWNFFPDQVFTVEVVKSASSLNYRGQCLAVSQTKEV